MQATVLDLLAPHCLVETDREESHKLCELGFHQKSAAILELLLI